MRWNRHKHYDEVCFVGLIIEQNNLHSARWLCRMCESLRVIYYPKSRKERLPMPKKKTAADHWEMYMECSTASAWLTCLMKWRRRWSSRKNAKNPVAMRKKSTAMFITAGSGMYSSRLGRMAALSRKWRRYGRITCVDNEPRFAKRAEENDFRHASNPFPDNLSASRQTPHCTPVYPAVFFVELSFFCYPPPFHSFILWLII